MINLELISDYAGSNIKDECIELIEVRQYISNTSYKFKAFASFGRKSLTTNTSDLALWNTIYMKDENIYKINYWFITLSKQLKKNLNDMYTCIYTCLKGVQWIRPGTNKARPNKYNLAIQCLPVWPCSAIMQIASISVTKWLLHQHDQGVGLIHPYLLTTGWKCLFHKLT